MIFSSRTAPRQISAYRSTKKKLTYSVQKNDTHFMPNAQFPQVLKFYALRHGVTELHSRFKRSFQNVTLKVFAKICRISRVYKTGTEKATPSLLT